MIEKTVSFIEIPFFPWKYFFTMHLKSINLICMSLNCVRHNEKIVFKYRKRCRKKSNAIALGAMQFEYLID